MTIRIFIKRKVADHNVEELEVLLRKLRGMTINQPGYISGETLKRVDIKGESVVISTWSTLEDWNRWVNSEERMALQTEVDQLLGIETEYAVYER